MSTLADFDAVAKENVIAGLTDAPKQCMVMDGSRLFAGNPSLPYMATYGSGQFEADLFNQAVHYAATTPTSQAPFHSCVPAIYRPSPSGNNNIKTTHDINISSQIDEDCVSNDDEDSSILSNLPNSCHDFELKELHIRLERNHSSPLIGGHSSPALSSRLSSNCPSAEPPTDPAEPEDLEVQFINESFEEQQRQSQMYQSGDLKSLFYHGSSEIDSTKVLRLSGTDKSVYSSLERPERLPYAKKLSSHETLINTHYECRPLTPPSFLKFSDSFEPLITPKSEALIVTRTMEEQKTSPNRRRVSEPLAQKPTLFWNLSLRADSSGLGSGSLFEPVNTSRTFIDKSGTAVTDCVSPDSSRCQDETEALAKGVIESLFSGIAQTPLTPEYGQKVCLDSVKNPYRSKAVRRLLFMDNASDCDAPENLVRHDKHSSTEGSPGVAELAETSCLSLTSPNTGSKVAYVEDTSKNEGPVVIDDGEDSWENLDDAKLEEQMNALKLEAASRRPIIDFYSPPGTTSSLCGPQFLSHVLEAYDVPEYVLAQDVVNALESTNFGSAMVKWLERKIVFIVFESERQARDALVFVKHQWLRLRPLSQSPARVQEKALEIRTQLEPTRCRPITNACVARRMIENTLGIRSSVTKEQREMEIKQLAIAKAAKNNCVQRNF